MKRISFAVFIITVIPFALFSQNNFNKTSLKKETSCPNKVEALKKVEKQNNAPTKISSCNQEKPTTRKATSGIYHISGSASPRLGTSPYQEPSDESYYFLGLNPESHSISDYNNAKSLLKRNNIDKYMGFMAIENNNYNPETIKKAQISRARFNQLPPLKQAKIKAHPERYEITE